MNRKVALVVALRALLLALLILGVARPDLPQFHGKGIVLRLVIYPLFTCVVPAIWLLRGRRDRYPYDVDALVILALIFDSAGNALNLYDRIWWWDKLEHGVNWLLLVTAFALVLLRTRVRRPELMGLAVGFGATAAIIWELGEYVSFIHSNHRELRIAYTNTLGDLLWGLTGSVVAAVLVGWRGYRGASS